MTPASSQKHRFSPDGVEAAAGAAATALRFLFACALAAFVLHPNPGGAQTGADDDGNPVKEHMQQLQDLQKVIETSEVQRRKIKTELEAIRNDRARLNSAIIEATCDIQKSEGRIADLGDKLGQSLQREHAIRKSLFARRAVIAEVLAALQRMGAGLRRRC